MTWEGHSFQPVVPRTSLHYHGSWLKLLVTPIWALQWRGQYIYLEVRARG